MDSREILPEVEEIHFLLDTSSFNSRSGTKHSILEKILRYKEHDDFDFLRSPDKTEYRILEGIDTYSIEKRGEENRRIITRDGEEDLQSVYTVNYAPELYEYRANEIYWNHPTPSPSDLDFIDLFSGIVGLRQERRANILITLNPIFLKNRRLMEYHVHNHKRSRMHIMTPSEAAELAGIYLRKNRDFVFYVDHDEVSRVTVDFSHWHWTFSQILIQHISFDEEGYLGSLQDRFQSLSVGLDELGEQYYSGTGNHTDLMTRYHFNNGISLLTGIFDVLALHTRDKYGMEINDRHTNLRTGEHPLLKELREYNERAWEYVHKNHEIIELLHIVRNDIIHQSGVITRGPGLSFRECSDTIPWQSHSILLENLDENDRSKFKKYYEGLDDSVQKYDPITKWGIITESDAPPEVYNYTQIEPYQFLKQSTKETAEFVDEYLSLLGHPNRLERFSERGPISNNDVQRMSKHGLHPFLHNIDLGSIT